MENEQSLTWPSSENPVTALIPIFLKDTQQDRVKEKKKSTIGFNSK